MQLIQIEDIRPAAKPPRFALFALGLRPFYLCAAAFAACALPLWLAMWSGGADLTPLPGLLWHAHELVYGFAAAVVAGFLFTAVRNWTGLAMPQGVSLALFVALWLAGRLGLLAGYNAGVAALDSLFLLALGGALARKFLRAGGGRNWALVAVVGALGLSNLAFHAAQLGWLGYSPLNAVEAGLMLVVLLETIIGGRVIPGFTANAAPGVRQYRRAWLERGALAATALAFGLEVLRAALLDAADDPTAFAPAAAALAGGLAACVAAVLQALRLAGWNPWSARAKPILWILHLSYAWIPAGLLLLGLAAFGLVPRAAAVHALAVGSMAGLIIAMITRTALGHTGRPLRAGRAEVACYVLVQAGAFLRVAAALAPDWHAAGVWLSGGAWTLAFALYFAAYWPILTRARADGRPG